jgi:hypothetical protein
MTLDGVLSSAWLSGRVFRNPKPCRVLTGISLDEVVIDGPETP